MKTPINPDAVERILVIKLCCIGDIVQMTPALKSLGARFPAARIDFLAASWVKNVAERAPGVNEVLVWDEPYGAISWLKGAVSFVQLCRRLAGRRYDLAFIGHRCGLFGLLSWISGIPIRAGFKNKGNFFLTHSAVFDEKIHEAKRYLAVARAIGAGSDENPEPALQLRNGDEAAALDLSQRFALTWDRPTIALFPGGGQNPGTSMKIKRWEKEKLAGLIRRLTQIRPAAAAFPIAAMAPNPIGGESRLPEGRAGADGPCQVLLMGNQGDRELCCWLKNAAGADDDSVIELAGQTTIPELLGLLKKCRLAIGGDSGPLYLAAAVGTPTLMLFGPSSPILVAPPGPMHRQMWKQVPCSPCYTPDTTYNRSRFEGNEFICWTKTHDCMKTLALEEVVQAVSEMLGAKRG